jgi:hypothetical protein
MHSKEDADAMNAILKVPSFEEYWIWKQQKQKPKFKSASLTCNNDKNICTLCGGIGHNVLECGGRKENLLYSSSCSF